ncbi:hypothetical protein D3M74_02305, partial [Rodentibacter pneumotropicus]
WPKNYFYLILYKIYYFLYFSILLCFFCKNKKSLVVYGADHIVGAKFFLKRFPFYVIEDGRANYISSNYIRSFRNKLFSIPSFGMHKTVKGIYFTSEDLDGLPEIIKNRAIFIDLKRMWATKSPAEQNNILSFLKIDINNIKKLSSKKFILFTQPLSEDGIVTEEEKIDIYRDILSKYDLDNLAIKPHPREKTNYEEIFKDVYVFKDTVPSEMLDILGVKFERVITLFSSAAFQYDKDIVDFYGTEAYPKLYKRFGGLKFN